MKRRNRSMSLSTGQTYLDPLQSSGYVSESEASFNESVRMGRRTQGRSYSASHPFNVHHENPRRSLPGRVERSSSEFILRENVLYQSVIRSNFNENAYEIINDDIRP